jgi:hypothetical protein
MKNTTFKKMLVPCSICLLVGGLLGRLSMQNDIFTETKIQSAHSMKDSNDPNGYYLLTISDLGQENTLKSKDGITYQNIDDIIEQKNTEERRKVEDIIRQDMIKNYGNSNN